MFPLSSFVLRVLVTRAKWCCCVGLDLPVLRQQVICLADVLLEAGQDAHAWSLLLAAQEAKLLQTACGQEIKRVPCVGQAGVLTLWQETQRVRKLSCDHWCYTVVLSGVQCREAACGGPSQNRFLVCFSLNVANAGAIFQEM